MKTAHISLTVDFNGFRDEDDIRKILNAIPQKGWYLGDSDGYTLTEDHWSYDDDDDLTTFEGSIPIAVTEKISSYTIAGQILEGLNESFHVWSVEVYLPNDRNTNVYALAHELLGID